MNNQEMRKKNFTLFLLFVFTLISCNKDNIFEKSPEELLTSKTWRYKTLTYNTPGDYLYLTCDTDSTIFKKNGEYTNTNCYNLSIGNWNWIITDKKFELEQYYSGELRKSTNTILQISDSLLIIRVENEGLSGYSEFKYWGKNLTIEKWA